MTHDRWTDHEDHDATHNAVLCRDLVKIFASQGVEVQALQGLTLKIATGEVAAIIGASGSGKSTLLSILSGQLTPSAGKAWVAGHDLTAMTTRERVHFARSSVGFVWQSTDRNLLPHLTAEENIMLPLTLGAGEPHRLRTRQRQRQRAHELLDALGLPETAQQLPAHMSGGQRQRLAIAVALAGNPRVVLADEPTGELDDEASRAVLDAFREVNKRFGTTVLIVTHDPTIADHVQRTVAIRDGRTSLEVVRTTRTQADGTVVDDVEEFAVIDQVGRLQIPGEFTHQLGLVDRVRVAMSHDHIEIWPEDAS